MLLKTPFQGSSVVVMSGYFLTTHYSLLTIHYSLLTPSSSNNRFFHIINHLHYFHQGG